MMFWKYFAIPILCLITLAYSESCPPPDIPSDGTYFPRLNKYSPGNNVSYTCKEGFNRQGNEIRRCMPSGNWSDFMPFCDRQLKLKVPLSSNSYYTNISHAIDNNTSTCLHWDQGLLEMNINKKVIVNTVMIFVKGPANLRFYSGQANNMQLCFNRHRRPTESGGWTLFECEDSHILADTLEITKDDGAITICEIKIYGNDAPGCDHPPKILIPNGFFEVSRNKATLHCEDGFTAVNSNLLCDSNKWKGLEPRCEENLCQPHVHNSTLDPGTEWIFLDSVRKFSPGSRRQLKCSPGYQKVGEPEEVTCHKNLTWTMTNATCTEVSATSKKKLLHYLFEYQDYDKRFRPVKNQKTFVPVKVDLTPLEMKYKVQENMTWKLDTWLAVKWKDEYLMWNPKDFGNIEQIFLPVSKVWRPDLSLYHNNLDSSFLSDVTTNVIVRFDGELTWVTLNSVVIQFDEKSNNCQISVKARTYDVSLMKVKAERQENKNLSHFKNHILKMKSIEVSEELGNFSWSEQPFSIINFNLKFAKRAKR